MINKFINRTRTHAMLSNIFITLSLLIVCFFLFQRIFKLPKNIWLLFLIHPLAASAYLAVIFVGGLLSISFGADPALVTLPITVMILGVACSSIPAALIAQRKGRRFAIFTGFTIGLCGSLLCALAAWLVSFELFVFACLFIGCCSAFIQQLRFAAIESLKHEKDIPTAISIIMLGGIFSAFLGPEIAVLAKDWIVSPHGYVGSFLCFSALFVITMLIMLKFENPQHLQQTNQGQARPLTTIIKQPIFIISIVAAAIGFGLMSYLMTATPLSMHHVHAHSLNDTKWVIQSHVAAMFIPSLFTAFLVKRFGLKMLLLTGSILYAIVAIIAFSGEQVLHYWWALVLLGVGWNFLFLTGTSLLPNSYRPAERHKTQALNDFIVFGFQATASLLAGWVLFKSNWHFLVITSLPFIMILFIASWKYFAIEQSNKTTNNE